MNWVAEGFFGGGCMVIGGDRTIVVGCVAYNSNNTGFQITVYGQALTNCIASKCNVGFDNSNTGGTFRGCTSYRSVTDGFQIDATRRTTVLNCLSVLDSGYGIDVDVSGYISEDYNAFYAPGTAETNNILIRGSHDITLSTNPLTDPENGDFSLKSTAECVGSGFLGVPISGVGVGYLDIGALQHQASGGGGSTIYIPHVIDC